MEKRLDLNPRQQKILYAMLTSDAPLPLPELADLVHVSVRTVQRDMRSLRSLLLKFGLEIASDGKRGQFVKGAEKDRQELRALLSQHEKPSMYTPEERRQGLIRDLLLAKEPIKLYTFSRQYDVTEATISYDMDKVEEWFQTYGIRVVRRPGLGVYLHGTEQQFRTGCVLFVAAGYDGGKMDGIVPAGKKSTSGRTRSTIGRQSAVSVCDVFASGKHPVCGESDKQSVANAV